MNNAELDSILKGAGTPEKSKEYLEEFPKRVLAEIAARQRRKAFDAQRAARPLESKTAPRSGLWPRAFKPAFAAGLALACLAIAFAFGFRYGRNGPGNDPDLAQALKCFREIEALFPNQVQAIAFDRHGMRLDIADHPDVPVSPPLYLKICGPKDCQCFITFSGQQIRMNGDLLDVLVDRQGYVLVMGRQWVWSSSNPADTIGPYRIAARPLLAKS
jgi:hypothetical protein